MNVTKRVEAPHRRGIPYLVERFPLALMKRYNHWFACAFAVAISVSLTAALWASDWPQWRGEGRRGVWTETGILERFPEGGLRETWRVPGARGYAGPAVASGRVFVTEFDAAQGVRSLRDAEADAELGEALLDQTRLAGIGTVSSRTRP